MQMKKGCKYKFVPEDERIHLHAVLGVERRVACEHVFKGQCPSIFTLQRCVFITYYKSCSRGGRGIVYIAVTLTFFLLIFLFEKSK